MTSAAAELEVMLEAPLAEAVGKVLTTGIVFEAAGVLAELAAGDAAAAGVPAAADGATAGVSAAADGATAGTSAGADGANGVPTATLGAGAAVAAGAAQSVDPMAVSTIGEQPFCTPVRVW